jgi:vacuolar-type H+-ATPase subunit I/STV1
MTKAGDRAEDVARTAKRSAPLRMLARLGFLVNGVLHVLIGVLAIQIALGVGDLEADQSGALQQVATRPGGIAVLWLVVIGLFALTVWQIVETVTVDEKDVRRRWNARVTEAGKAVVYAAIGATAFVFAVGGTTSTAATTRMFSGDLLASPGGVVLLIAVGLGVFIAGVSFVVIGIRRRFSKLMTVPRGGLGRVVSTVAIFGYIAKGIAIAVVGILFVGAALTSDVDHATGLDGALEALAALPFGVFILFVIGIGMMAFGVFLFARARWARL